jgi:uncharacterized protein (TIGR02302 family)
VTIVPSALAIGARRATLPDEPEQRMASGNPNRSQRTLQQALDAKVSAARRVVTFERVWPLFVAPAAILALFLGLSWLGLWLEVPRWARAAGVALFAGAFVWSLKGFLTLRTADADDGRTRLDRDSGVPHRPVQAVSDTMALGSDETSRALWALHQKRASEAISRLRVAAPDPAVRRKDPAALRFAPFVLAIGALFAAGPDYAGRVGAAFQWFEPPPPPPLPRLDAWLDPPGYTGRPPQFLVRSQQMTPVGAASGAVRAPTGSTLVVRATPAEGVRVEVVGDLKEVEAAASAPLSGGQPSLEKRFTLTGEAVASILRGQDVLARFPLSAIADKPPTITLKDAVTTGKNDGLRLTYSVQDDYGAREGEASFTLPQKSGEPSRRTLVEPPSGVLALPYGAQGEADGETVIQLQDHPWGGARVRVQLHVKDAAGHEAQSETREVTLPQRAFSNPLAKALVEQRRNIVLDPDRKDRVQIALDALLIEPERFLDKQWGAYMGLRLASDRLRKARNDAQLLGVAEWLWTMAIELEDGGLSDAEKALRQAQERLREALERNADANEIKRLTEELRRAMDRFMRELAEKALRDNRNAENQPRDENMRTMRPEDFRKMLEEIERLAREGKTAEAQQLLEQLRRMMENLQAQRGQRQMGERERGQNEAMNELDRMTREQQQLRDRTYREGQERRRRELRAQRERQQGRQGQPGRQQPGQPGGEQGDEGEDGQEGQQGLQERQEALRQQLERLQRRMRDLGMNGEQGLADAEQAMRDAERQLGQGQENGAVGSQGRALEGLRRGMQGMAQQMQQQGDGDGTEQADGGPGGDDPNRPGQPRANGQGGERDPLNRKRNNRGQMEDGRLRMHGGEGGTVGDRSRRVLEELRRKLGESERPKLELDYFERLLPKN